MKRVSIVPSRVPVQVRPPKWLVANRGNLILACLLGALLLVAAGHCHDTTPAFAQVGGRP